MTKTRLQTESDAAKPAARLWNVEIEDAARKAPGNDRNRAERNYYASVIEDKVTNVKEEFFRIGYLLNLIRADIYSMTQGFRGYDSVYDWAERKLGFKATTVKNLMRVNAEYSDKTDPDIVKVYYPEIGNSRIAFSPVMAEPWKAYTQTQLVEMLPLDFEERRRIDPLTPVTEIRASKKKTAPATGQSTDRVSVGIIPGQTTIDDALSAADPEIVVKSEPVTVDELRKPEKIEIAETVPASVIRPAKLALKNKTERENWLTAYKKHCYLWIEVAPLGAKFYRYDFLNGDYLIVTETSYEGKTQGIVYQRISGKKSNDYYCHYYWTYWTDTIGQIVQWMTENKNKI